jgi:hypothetical protein
VSQRGKQEIKIYKWKKSFFPGRKTILSKNLKTPEKPVIKPVKPACQIFFLKNWVFANPGCKSNIFYVSSS